MAPRILFYSIQRLQGREAQPLAFLILWRPFKQSKRPKCRAAPPAGLAAQHRISGAGQKTEGGYTAPLGQGGPWPHHSGWCELHGLAPLGWWPFGLTKRPKCGAGPPEGLSWQTTFPALARKLRGATPRHLGRAAPGPITPGPGSLLMVNPTPCTGMVWHQEGSCTITLLCQAVSIRTSG